MTQLEPAHGRVQICRINQPPRTQFRARTPTATYTHSSSLPSSSFTSGFRRRDTMAADRELRNLPQASWPGRNHRTVLRYRVPRVLDDMSYIAQLRDPKRAIVPRRRSVLSVPAVPTPAMYLATCYVGNFGNFDTLD